MDEALIPGREEERRVFNQFAASYDAPAYARRARATHLAYEHLVARLRDQREEWLALVRTRLATALALAGSWDNLRPFLADAAALDALRHLHQTLDPKLRLPVEPTASPRVLRRAVRELADSLGRFNRRWRDHLAAVDLHPVNQLRDGYNRYYILEKECSIRSPRLARAGFQPLPALTVDDLARLFPLLPGVG